MESCRPLRPAPEVIYGPVGDRILIARAGDPQCFDLQGTGADMWTAVVDRGTVQGAVEQLHRRYNVEKEQLHKDISHLVDQLLQNGLLEDTRTLCAVL